LPFLPLPHRAHPDAQEIKIVSPCQQRLNFARLNLICLFVRPWDRTSTVFRAFATSLGDLRCHLIFWQNVRCLPAVAAFCGRDRR
jgi:hypothetical protein